MDASREYAHVLDSGEVKHRPGDMSTKDKPDRVVTVISSLGAAATNTAIVAGSIFINPSQSSTVNLYIASNVADTATQQRRPVRITSFYKWLTAGILLVAVGCLLLWFFAVGYVFPEPTAAQAKFITALDWGWKMGFGVVIGLVGGKVVPDTSQKDVPDPSQ